MNHLKTDIRATIIALIVFWAVGVADQAYSYTANKVWMEFRTNGRYRVYVNYTVPALREFREAWVEFAKKKEAESYYFDLVRGADFSIPESKKREFKQSVIKPTPW